MPLRTRTWEEGYAEYAAFVCTHGQNSRPSETTDYRVHRWSNAQRKQKSTLTTDQIQRLNELHFDWETNEMKLERKWQTMFQLLQEFRKTHGTHIRVKQSVVYQGKPLGVWVTSQRTLYKSKKLAAHRIQQLETIGFEWVINNSPHQETTGPSGRHTPVLDKAWMEKFDDLCEYKKRHSNTLVPKGYMVQKKNEKEGRYNLGRWVGGQRAIHREGLLKPHRRTKLESIGFVFLIDSEDPKASLKEQQWGEWFGKLVDYKATHNGSCHVSADDDPGLARWVSKQRAEHAKNTLVQARFQKLDELGLQWGASQDDFCWDTMVYKLRQFKKTHGHCRCDEDSKNHSRLARWVKRVRNRRNGSSRSKTILEPEQIAQLDELGFEWENYHSTREDGLSSFPGQKRKTPSSEEADDALDSVNENKIRKV